MTKAKSSVDAPTDAHEAFDLWLHGLRGLDAMTDAVLRYRPKARSKPAVQRKRRKTILDKKRAAQK